MYGKLGGRRRGEGRSSAIVGVMIGGALLLIAASFVFRSSWLYAHRGPPSRRMRCSQQMRDIAQAMNTYEMDKLAYPGYRNVLMRTNDTSFVDSVSGEGGVSWVVPLLPYMDYDRVYDTLRTPTTTTASSNVGGSTSGPIFNATSARITLENFICPSDPPAIMGGTPLAYMVNTGCIDSAGTATSATSPGVPRDWQANGVFFDHYTGYRKAKIVLRPDGKPIGELADDEMPIVLQTAAWIAAHDGNANTILRRRIWIMANGPTCTSRH